MMTTNATSDKSADGIGVVDVVQKKLPGKIFRRFRPGGFPSAKDGAGFTFSNEDVKTASVDLISPPARWNT